MAVRSTLTMFVRQCYEDLEIDVIFHLACRPCSSVIVYWPCSLCSVEETWPVVLFLLDIVYTVSY
jgi:hypothetical protein